VPTEPSTYQQSISIPRADAVIFSASLKDANFWHTEIAREFLIAATTEPDLDYRDNYRNAAIYHQKLATKYSNLAYQLDDTLYRKNDE